MQSLITIGCEIEKFLYFKNLIKFDNNKKLQELQQQEQQQEQRS